MVTAVPPVRRGERGRPPTAREQSQGADPTAHLPVLLPLMFRQLPSPHMQVEKLRRSRGTCHGGDCQTRRPGLQHVLGTCPCPALRPHCFVTSAWLRRGVLPAHEPLRSPGELEKRQGARTLSFKSGGAQVDPPLKQGSPTGEPETWGVRPQTRRVGARATWEPLTGLGFLGDGGEGALILVAGSCC